MTRFATLFLLAATVVCAADVIDVPFRELCLATHNRPVSLTMSGGEVVSGRCLTVDVDEIAIRKDNRTIRITRSAIARIQVSRAAHGKQLPALHREVHRSLRTGLSALFSPLAPVGLVAVPGTLAWAAVSAPFCALNDLGADLAGSQEIRVH